MSKGKLYRYPNRGKVMGVCAGISRWLNVDLGLVRLGFIIAFFISGGTVLLVYLALGIFLPISDSFDNASHDYDDRTFRKKRGGVTVEDVKDEFDNLKSRVGKMEDTVFNKERDWDERFKRS